MFGGASGPISCHPYHRMTTQDAPLASGQEELLGLRIASGRDLSRARSQAVRLIGPHLASLDVLKRTQTEGALLAVYQEDRRVSGLLAILQLSPAGCEALLNAQFRPLNPDREHLACEPKTAALYGWACAGASPAARRAVMQTLGALLRERFARLPFYAHAATDAGRRALVDSLGCRSVPGAPPALYWRNACSVAP